MGKKSNNNFKVVIRVRPPLERELHSRTGYRNVVKCGEKHIIISENLEGDAGLYSTHKFTFDRVYNQKATQTEVYNSTANSAVQSILEGYNATIIAYGQTGTGKTHTMEGFTNDDQRGIIPRATEKIFEYIEKLGSNKTKFLVRASYLQIYNEQISDLLKPSRTNLYIREDKKRGVYVEGLSEWIVRNPTEIYGLMERGARLRVTGSTRMNHLSSRSHAVFIIICEQSETSILDPTGKEIDLETFKQKNYHEQDVQVRQAFKIGKLNLVDLAGSERVKFSGATGSRLKESQNINQSLSALGNVIAALTSATKRNHIPYRDSKLTRLLEDSLGGNCKTTMMAMISPALESFLESISTLKFAHRAKQIKNTPHVNEDLDQRALLRRYEQELKKLRTELEKKKHPGQHNDMINQLRKQAQTLEQDKMAAMEMLQQQSREFMEEKAQKRQLEQRIAYMQSQMLTGGEKVEETPVFRNLLNKEYARVHREYEEKVKELERERNHIEEDKAQVDRYKQLLLKQRDIMIALTARLNERDETILSLQEELEAYDLHQHMLEETLDRKTEQLLEYQKRERERGGKANGTAAAPQKQDSAIYKKMDDLEERLAQRDQFIRSQQKTIRRLKQQHGMQRDDAQEEDKEEEEEEDNTLSQLRAENEALTQRLQQADEASEFAQNAIEKQKTMMERLQKDNDRLLADANQVRDNLDHLSSLQQDDALKQQLASAIDQNEIYKQTCFQQDQEKQAIKMILEKKMAPYIQNIYAAVNQLDMGGDDAARQQICDKLIVPLHKLVAASASALEAPTQEES